jgi:hypothetical protein
MQHHARQRTPLPTNHTDIIDILGLREINPRPDANAAVESFLL